MQKLSYLSLQSLSFFLPKHTDVGNFNLNAPRLVNLDLNICRVAFAIKQI